MARKVTLDKLPQVQLLEDISRDSAARLIAQFAAFRGQRVALNIFSNGGDAQGSLAVAQYISNPVNDVKVEVRVYGNAASGAMIIAAAADKAYISEGAFALVHYAYAAGVDDADLTDEDKAILASINESQVDLFASRTGKKASEVKKLLAENRTITDDEAVSMGLFDGIIPMAARIAAHAEAHKTIKMSEKKTRSLKVSAADALKAIASGTIEVPEENFTVSEADKVDELNKQIEALTKERDDLKAAKDESDTKVAEGTAKVGELEKELVASKEAVGKYQASLEALKKNPLVAQVMPDGTSVVVPGAAPGGEKPQLSAEAQRVKSANDAYNDYFERKANVNKK